MKIFYKITIAFLLFSLIICACQPQGETAEKTSSANYFRIVVPSEGYYQISLRELIEIGLLATDLNKINLYHFGKPYPFWIIDENSIENSTICFYAPQAEKSSNISETIFILAVDENGPSTRLIPQIIESENHKIASVTEGIHAQHIEEQVLYLPDSKGEDRWFWSQITAENDFTVEFSIPEQILSPIKVRINLWSPTSAPINPDHSIQILINHTNSQEISWEGKGEYTSELVLNPSRKGSDYSIRILPHELEENFPQKIFINWIEIEYQKTLHFTNQTQQFISTMDLVVATDQSDGVLVSSSRELIPQDVFLIPQNTISKIPSQTDTVFSWVPKQNFVKVTMLQSINNPQFDLPSADYVVIAPQEFHTLLEPLISLRQQQGLTTALLSPQEIYDLFTSGTPSPFAILKFLQQLKIENEEFPKYLLLVGDYSFEIIDYQTSLHMLPSFFLDTSLAGQTVSDFPFSDVDGDFKPDLSIGRIPASNSEQVTIWVEKLLAFENQSAAHWKQIITVSDSSSPVFEQSAIEFQNHMGEITDTSMFYFHGDEHTLSNNQNVFSESSSLMVYLGHGSIDRWGKDEILSSSKLKSLDFSIKPELIFSFSCLNGYFIHPQKESITESLLFQPDVGSIGIVASTSLTMHEYQLLFSNQIISELQLKRYTRFGDLISSAMRELDPQTQLAQDILNTFMIFGDPATSFPHINAPQGN